MYKGTHYKPLEGLKTDVLFIVILVISYCVTRTSEVNIDCFLKQNFIIKCFIDLHFEIFHFIAHHNWSNIFPVNPSDLGKPKQRFVAFRCGQIQKKSFLKD